MFIFLGFNDEKKLFVKEKTEKKKATEPAAVYEPEHPIASGINEGFVRGLCVYAERFGLGEGAANLLSHFPVFLQTEPTPA
jgi:trehalose utilization protein